ncbi:MAG TPA: cryptochrome/photolyase family protein [Oligoflexia bacterium]|nr:cryptochrome/photolyase family protein [Oligoflexia bacterium]HMP48748.1 cryptochrome/photolyase family protein [Oligoflexia bacterium]
MNTIKHSKQLSENLSESAEVSLFYPHQIFDESELIKPERLNVLIEDPLFFSQYPFHKQKLMLHRASMKAFEERLKNRNLSVMYVESDQLENTEDIITILKQKNCSTIFLHDPVDNWLEKKLKKSALKYGITVIIKPSPNFLTSNHDADNFFDSSKKYFFSSFYIYQRKSLGIMLDNENKPIGGKWTFDAENRLKLPKDHTPPEIRQIKPNPWKSEARNYIEKHFPNNPGACEEFNYPVTPAEAREVLETFLNERIYNFGIYEDAISKNHRTIYHSLLSAPLNIGLLSPKEIIDRTLEVENITNLPINSIEGFLRQIIGWREYMQIVYRREGTRQRNRNFWNHNRKIPESFWNGSTGIIPIDTTINNILKTAYCHHIERLMILGNFMLLSEFDPDEVYQWFMCLFIDSYDWVMVPNVYAMSQFAEGGEITTKPYISSSNYVLKMSDYKKENWCEVWDALYWSFIDKKRNFFLKNQRMSIMPRQFDKMEEGKKNKLKQTAKTYFNSIKQPQ